MGNLRQHSCAAVLFWALMVTGCNDLGGTTAIPLPTSFDLEFVGLTEGQQVFGTIPLYIKVADDAEDNNVTSIRVFPMDLEDTDVRSLHYRASWDTSQSPEGDVTLEALAQTTSGRIGRGYLTVRVIRTKGTGISGTASLGRPIAGGTVTVFARSGVEPAQELGSARTAADGQFNVPYVDEDYTGPVLLRVSGKDATFIDPVSGALVYFTDDDALWSAAPASDGVKPTGIAINALTHLVVETARGLAAEGRTAADALALSESLHTSHVYGQPFSMHQPLDTLTGVSEWPNPATAVGLFHKGLSTLAATWAQRPTPIRLLDFVAALSADVRDGVFDGMGDEGLPSSPVPAH